MLTERESERVRLCSQRERVRERDYAQRESERERLSSQRERVRE